MIFNVLPLFYFLSALIAELELIFSIILGLSIIIFQLTLITTIWGLKISC